MIFSQYVKHPEYKSLAPDEKPCQPDSKGLLQRYPVTASEFILVGKETERGWEQAEDISTLLASLMRYDQNTDIANQQLRARLNKLSLNALQKGNRLEQKYHPSCTAGRARTPEIPSTSQNGSWYDKSAIWIG